MTRPIGISDEQLHTIMMIARAVRREHRGWILHAIVGELQHTHDINEAVNAALAHLQQKVAA